MVIKNKTRDESYYLFKLGLLAFDNDDMERAYDFILKSAQKENPCAMHFMGLKFGFDKKYDESKFWLKSAVSAGYKEAYADYAKCLYEHFCCKENKDEIIKTLEKACTFKMPKPYYILSTIYREGKLVKEDYKKSFELLLEGSKYKGKYIMWILNDIGVCYEHGYGVEADIEKAAEYYEKSADLGFPRACYNLGLLYKDGWKNHNKDVEKAFDLLFEALKHKDKLAPAALIELYNSNEFPGKCQDIATFISLRGIDLGSTESYLYIADGLLGGIYKMQKDIESGYDCIKRCIKNAETLDDDFMKAYEKLKTKYCKLKFWPETDKMVEERRKNARC